MKEVTVEVELEEFIATMDFLKDDFYKGSEEKWDILMDAIRERPERWNLLQGPLELAKCIGSETVVMKREFREKYPECADVMTWEEFVDNECSFGNDKGAVVELQ